MNTAKYKRFFGKLFNSGDIPEDLYVELMSAAEQKGKVDWEIYRMFLDGLERRRLFETEGTPFSTEKSAKTDGSYVYLRPKNPFWHIGHAVMSTVFKFLGWLGSGLVYGVWRIKDRKKLKKLGPCISVSNHFGYIDAALTRYAFGCKKQYIIAAPHNCKQNLGGAIIRAATAIPLPINFRGTKAFGETLKYMVARGASLHIYAEKSMWLRYKKPRPFMDGAFHYADRLDIPVVVMQYHIVPSKGLRKLFGLPKAVVRIADPIYSDKTLPPRQRQLDLKARAEAAAKQLYEEFYGEPLEYLDAHTADDASEASFSETAAQAE